MEDHGEKWITIHPEICHGNPGIRGTRISVDISLELLEHESTFPEILEEYPQQEKMGARTRRAHSARYVAPIW